MRYRATSIIHIMSVGIGYAGSMNHSMTDATEESQKIEKVIICPGSINLETAIIMARVRPMASEPIAAMNRATGMIRRDVSSDSPVPDGIKSIDLYCISAVTVPNAICVGGSAFCNIWVSYFRTSLRIVCLSIRIRWRNTVVLVRSTRN